MKTFISLMILMIGLLDTLPYSNQVQASNPTNQTSFVVDNQSTAPAALTQEEGGVQAKPEQTNVGQEDSGSFFSDNWGALLMGLFGFIDLVARLTPSEKDNSIVNFLMTLFNAIIPNFRKGGGSFKLLSK
ncbi:MAG: hypothetical protein Q8S54_20020 [Bacteroidota bacterium]|nr:hypothetical protein [Bacteroidota bacterium]